jgi:hypothetical protein
MAILSTTELKTLVEQPTGHCVSIFLPTHIAGPNIQQDPIRFKNLVSKAEEQLVENGMRRATAEKFLQPAKDLDQPDFWRHQRDGLAIFIADNFFQYYRLPLNFEELVVTGKRFHLKPLMPLLSGDGRFFVLALSLNKVRLFEGSRDRIMEINLNSLDEVPQSLQEAVYAYEDAENQTHMADKGTISPAGAPGSDPGVLHGRGVDEDLEEKKRRFCSYLDKGLQEFLRDKQAPLILAAVEKLVSSYKDMNSYQHLLDEYIEGNPDVSTLEDIHKQAWDLVSPHFQKAQVETAQRYAEFSGNNPEQASKDLEEIVKAAYYQRVDSLIASVNQHRWGHFDPESNSVEIHDTEQPGDEDLIDFAAVHSALNGAPVFIVPDHEVPDDTPATAILRY